MEAADFCNLISGMTSHHFCQSILSGEGITQGHAYRQSLGAILEAICNLENAQKKKFV